MNPESSDLVIMRTGRGSHAELIGMILDAALDDCG